MERPFLRPNGVVLDSPDTRQLAAFSERLLGWPRRSDEPDWVTLRPPDGGIGLSFQTETKYVRPVRPVWPAGEGDPRAMTLVRDKYPEPRPAGLRHRRSPNGRPPEATPRDASRGVDPKR
jgi:hypothetical protein